MPRVEFETYTDAEVWLKKVVSGSDKNYIGYLTKENELIFVPTKSTQPIIYGYVRTVADTEAKDFSKHYLVPIFKINKFEWNAERGMPKGE